MNYKTIIAQTLSAFIKIDESYIEVPKDKDNADYALPCFRFAKELKKSPNVIAKELDQQIGHIDGISSHEVVGGYINFFVDKATRAKNVLCSVGSNYGSSDMGGGKTVCIDFSSINIAKPFHIGHLSTTAIGNSLYRIFNYLGYKSYGINYLGDWGTQFGKLIVAYKLWGDHDTIERDGIRAMLKIYVQFHDEAEKDESLNDQARAWFKKIEDGDPEAMELFLWFKERTLKDVSKIYDDLDVHFDSFLGESFYNDKMQPVIDKLKEKNLLIKSNGAFVVDLEAYDMPPCLILKQDGATLYATRDLASAIYRKDNYNFDQSLYVVAYQQTLHFKQVFKVLELMGYDFYKNCHHVAFGMVSMEAGTLSTRKGNVIFLDDVLKMAVDKTLKTINEKNPDLENKEDVAKQVGTGAVVFSAVCNNRINDITFSFDRILSFEGETGPYVQYTHARCCSVLNKSTLDYSSDLDYSLLQEPDANELIRLLDEFPQVIVDAAAKYEPAFITRHVISLASVYNKFYFENRIISSDIPLTKARLALTKAVATTIKQGLYLVGIKAPERM